MIELAMSMRKKYATASASVNATGGTVNVMNTTYCASNGIDGGTGCNFIFSFKTYIYLRDILMN